MHPGVIDLIPYAGDLVGSICIAVPWLQDQQVKRLFEFGSELQASKASAFAELGQAMRDHGITRFVGVDKWQRRLVKAGIALLCLSFVWRVGTLVSV
jgi:hypothetical protein